MRMKFNMKINTSFNIFSSIVSITHSDQEIIPMHAEEL